MHLLFIDESGTPPRPTDTNPSYFVVGGIVIPETSWHRMRDGLMGIKIRRKVRGEIKWRYFAASNTQAHNPMRALPQAERDAIREEVYKLMASDPSVKTLACVASAKAAYATPAINTQADLYHGTFKPVTERFQYLLQDVSKKAGSKQFGSIICDHRGAQDDKRLRAHHEMLLHSASSVTSKYGNLIEGLFIQPSNLSIGIQLADMVAGAVWQKFERGNDKYYQMLLPSMRKDDRGITDGYGLVKLPKANFV